MSNFIVKKVSALPLTYTPNTLYVVSNTEDNSMSLYMSSSDGLSVRTNIDKRVIERIVTITTEFYEELVPENCESLTISNIGSTTCLYSLDSSLSNAEFSAKNTLIANQIETLNTANYKAFAARVSSGSTSLKLTGIFKL